MKIYLHILRFLPITKGVRVSMKRRWLQSEYSKDIKAAQKSMEFQKAKEIRDSYRMELDLHAEEEDAYVTQQLLDKTRKFRVPIPNRFNPDNTESDHWYEGHYTGQWYLTVESKNSISIITLNQTITRKLIINSSGLIVL